MLGPRAILCAVIDAAALGPDPTACARALFEAGVDWIQLRDRSREDSELWRIARALVAARDAVDSARVRDPRESVRDPKQEVRDPQEGVCDPHERAPLDLESVVHRVIVNKRVDLARSTGADGAHLGFDALGPEESRALLGARALVGGSLHSVEEVAAARDRGFDYVHLAPIWPPRSKPATRPALGLEALAAACRAGPPVLAQGGVDPERSGEAVRAGAAGVAVTGILLDARGPSAGVESLRAALDAAHGRRREPPSGDGRSRAAS